MKIIVIGATGTIGAAVANALAAKKHEVVRASRQGDVKVNLEDQATIGALFAAVRNADAVISCAGSAVFKPFAELTDADSAGVTALLLGICSELAIANVLAVHVRLTLVELVAVAVGPVGAVGAVVSAGVVTVAVLDGVETLPAASCAVTV